MQSRKPPRWGQSWEAANAVPSEKAAESFISQSKLTHTEEAGMLPSAPP